MPDVAPGGRRYEVHELLGQGGFGSVYRADMVGHGGFSKAVALKILNPDMEGLDDVARRLRDEARMLGLLRHRAIVQVNELLVLDGRWTIVMEYVEGVDLRTLMDGGPCPIGVALDIVAEVAAALHVAYDRPTASGAVLKVLHRDIKPGNIQLTALGEVKVLDFGIARAEFGEREAKTKSVMYGSVPYMSPERLDFEDSHAGDMYALGVVLFELLVGDVLGKTSANDKRHAEFVATARERLVASKVDPEVREFILRALAYEPADRPSARDFERAARQLRSKFPEPTLQDFAEGRVAAQVGKRERTRDELSGRVLSESTSRRLVAEGSSASPAPANPAAPATTWERRGASPDEAVSSGRRAVVPAMIAGTAAAGALAVVGAVALVALVGLVWFGWAGFTPASPPSEVAPVVVVEAPKPPEAPVPVPVEVAPAVEPQPSKPTPAPRVVSKPAAVATTPAISVAAAPENPVAQPEVAPVVGTVRVTGDATNVVLLAHGKRYPAGDVPPGTYEVLADFRSKSQMEAGSVTVLAGQTVSLRCVEGFLRCAQN